MAIEYLGLSQINGSLIAIEGMKDATVPSKCLSVIRSSCFSRVSKILFFLPAL